MDTLEHYLVSKCFESTFESSKQHRFEEISPTDYHPKRQTLSTTVYGAYLLRSFGG